MAELPPTGPGHLYVHRDVTFPEKVQASVAEASRVLERRRFSSTTEPGEHGVTVNAGCRGLFETEMVMENASRADLAEFTQPFPVRRLGAPEVSFPALLWGELIASVR